MAKLFDLTIITPDEIVYEGKALSLVAPCALGYLGVLGDHAPLIANMKAGKITLKEESGKSIFFDTSTAFKPCLKHTPLSINPEQPPAFKPECVEGVDSASNGFLQVLKNNVMIILNSNLTRKEK